MPVEPLISVVIPTFARPELVMRAVRSVQQQSWRELEIIVVIDGPDDQTRENLGNIKDERIKIVALTSNLGVSSALNRGIAEARADWVAFLDDDDEWYPEKLVRQFDAISRARRANPIICCRMQVRNSVGEMRWPLRLPDAGEPLSEYLFSQRGLRGGEGIILPSAIMTRKALLEAVPFQQTVHRYQDIDWLLRANTRSDVEIIFVETTEPLFIYHMDDDRPRADNSPDWRYSLAWLTSNRELFTPRAYASFLLTNISKTAARTGDWRLFIRLIYQAFRDGRPSLIDLIAHGSIWGISQTLRNRILNWWDRLGGRGKR